jgi:biotin carboxyl carrier protein
LLVIEAMKMQNEIRSPKKGTIKEISVKDGIAVSTGDFLLSLE